MRLILVLSWFLTGAQALARLGVRMSVEFPVSTLKVQRAQMERQLKDKVAQMADLSKEIPNQRAAVFFSQSAHFFKIKEH